MNTHIPLPDMKGVSCADIEVQLFQLSTRLAMPVGDKVTLKGDHCGDVTLFLPAVKEKTIFRVAYKNAAPGKLPDTLVAVYPADLWAPLTEWSESNNLIVNDRGGKLIPLLEKHAIRYSPVVLPDNGGHVRQVCIWVPVSDDDAEAPFDCTPVIVLHEKTENLPMIHTLESPNRYRVDVYMPLLPALADHPLAQKTFIDLIQSTLRGD
jgi:hypothetical protein